MSNLKIRQGDWVVVCDGAKALILENVGDDKLPNLKTREVHEQNAPRPTSRGPMRRGARSTRSAPAQRDGADRLARAGRTAVPHRSGGRLDAAVTAGDTKSIIMVAPPRALGVMRQAYSRACATRCAPRSTRISSGCRCTRSRRSSRRDHRSPPSGRSRPSSAEDREGGRGARGERRAHEPARVRGARPPLSAAGMSSWRCRRSGRRSRTSARRATPRSPACCGCARPRAGRGSAGAVVPAHRARAELTIGHLCRETRPD